MKKNIIFCFCFIFFHAAVNADTNSAKLKNLSGQISKVKIELTQKKNQQKTVKQQLAELENKIKVLEKRYKDTAVNLKLRKEGLVKIGKDQVKQQFGLKEAQDRLSSQINSAYQLKSSGYLKVFLNKKEKINSGLLLEYHRYIFMERIKQMRDISKTLERIEKNREKIKKQTKDLEILERKQRGQKIELENTKKNVTKF